MKNIIESNKAIKAECCSPGWALSTGRNATSNERKIKQIAARAKRAGLKCERSRDGSLCIDRHWRVFESQHLETRPSPVDRRSSVNRLTDDHDGFWTVEYAGRTSRTADTVGLRYCSHLLQRAHTEVHVSSLVTAVHGEPVDIVQERELSEEDVSFESVGVDFESGESKSRVRISEFMDEILPNEARGRILDELENLREEVLTFKARGKQEEVINREQDIAIIEQYLRQTRFRSRNATFDDRAEKDRKSVANAIRRTIDNLAESHPEFSNHLKKTIRTGEYCVYAPKPDVNWAHSKMMFRIAP